MSEEEFSKICEKHGSNPKDVRRHIRKSKLKAVKSKIVVELRNDYDMTFDQIANIMGYYDKSGARQAFIYALSIL